MPYFPDNDKSKMYTRPNPYATKMGPYREPEPEPEPEPKTFFKKGIHNIQKMLKKTDPVFQPQIYKQGRLTLRGQLNKPRVDIGWNPNLSTTPFGGPTISNPIYGGNISANLKLRKNLSLYGNVDYRSGAQPEYKAGLRLRFKKGGYKPKFCW